MTGWYQPSYPGPSPQPQADPYDSGLRTADGEKIYLGPFTAAQAPHLICSNCEQPITVGQEVMPDMTKKKLGIAWPSGRLTFVSMPSDEEVAPCHADECCTEYSHDYISQDECAANEDAVPCSVCGVPTNGDEGLCATHSERLDGEAE